MLILALILHRGEYFCEREGGWCEGWEVADTGDKMSDSVASITATSGQGEVDGNNSCASKTRSDNFKAQI